jgi:hypothetical protein
VKKAIPDSQTVTSLGLMVGLARLGDLRLAGSKAMVGQLQLEAGSDWAADQDSDVLFDSKLQEI